MANPLKQALSRTAPAAAREAMDVMDEMDTMDTMDGMDGDGDVGAPSAVSAIRSIDTEVVLGGVLMRIGWRPGTDPARIGELLRQMDPGVKVRNEFPRAGGGRRELKLARVLIVTAKGGEFGLSIDLTCNNGEDDLPIAVGKKGAAEFLPSVRALGKLSEAQMSKLEKAASEKRQAVAMLGESEQFGVRYWTADDGRAFVEEVTIELPAVAVEGGSHG